MKKNIKFQKILISFVFLSTFIIFSTLTAQAAINTSTVSEGRYRLKNLNGKYLTMSTDKNGGALKMKKYDSDSKNQVFIQEKDGSNKYYTLEAYASSADRVVNVYADKSSSGKKVVLYKKDTNKKTYKTQRWYWVYDSKNKAYSIRPADNTKLALTVSGDTVKVSTFKKNNKNQLWQYKKIPVTKVTLSYPALAMKKGTSFTLKATVSPAFATDKKITWKSNSKKVTVNTSGKVTVSKTANVTSTAKITATNKDSGKTASCIITPASKVPVSSVNITTESCTLIPGETKQLKVKILPETATNTNVTWASSDASIVTVSSKGVLTAKAPGSAIITVKTTDKGKKSTCKVTVENTYKMNISCLNQGYEGWASELMGTDDPAATIGQWGCLTTTLATMENYYNRNIFKNEIPTHTPLTIEKRHVYVKGSLQGTGLWTPKYYNDITKSYTAIYEQLQKGIPVLLCIDYGTTHWVIVYGYKNVKYVNGKLSLSAKNFYIADSGGAYAGSIGDRKSGKKDVLLSEKYGKNKILQAKIRTMVEWK